MDLVEIVNDYDEVIDVVPREIYSFAFSYWSS